jgi:hypothetical protein
VIVLGSSLWMTSSTVGSSLCPEVELAHPAIAMGDVTSSV